MTNLKVSETITLHLRIGQARSHARFGVISQLVVLLLLVMTYIDKFIKLIHAAERKIVPHHFIQIPILIIQEEKCEAEIQE